MHSYYTDVTDILCLSAYVAVRCSEARTSTRWTTHTVYTRDKDQLCNTGNAELTVQWWWTIGETLQTNISVGLRMTYWNSTVMNSSASIASVFKPRKPGHDSQRTISCSNSPMVTATILYPAVFTDKRGVPWNNPLLCFTETNNLASHMNRQAPPATDSFRATAKNRKKVGARQPFASFSLHYIDKINSTQSNFAATDKSTRDMFGVSTKTLRCY